MAEETGAQGRLVEKLGDVRYVYTWDGERIFKVVSFFSFATRAGAWATCRRRPRTRWTRCAGCPLEEAPRLLAYGGEREMAAKAIDSRQGTMIPRASWQETTTPCTP